MMFRSIRLSTWRGVILRPQISYLWPSSPQLDRYLSTFQTARQGASLSRDGKFNNPQTYGSEHLSGVFIGGDRYLIMPTY